MAWTPATANYQWFFVDQTPSVLGNASNTETLLCYAYAQGYNRIVLQNVPVISTGNFTSPYQFSNPVQVADFVTAANAKGIQVGVDFKDSKTIQAAISYNTIYNLTRLKALVSTSEFWNYSYNLPFPDPETDNTSLTTLYNACSTYKAAANAKQLDIIVTVGDGKYGAYLYNSGIKIDNVNTSTNSFELPVNLNAYSTQFVYIGDTIKVYNYPNSGTDTVYTVTNITHSGITSISVGSTLTNPSPPSDAKIGYLFNATNSDGSFTYTNKLFIPGNRSSFLSNLFNVSGYNGSPTKNYLYLSDTALDDGYYEIDSWTYNISTQTTEININAVLTSLITGFVNLDVVHNGSYIPNPSDPTSVEQNSDYFTLITKGATDQLFLTDYNTPDPNYQDIQPRLVTIDSAINYGPVVPYPVNVLFSNPYINNFLEGKNVSGSLVYELKNPNLLYKYIFKSSYGILTPSRTGTPLYGDLDGGSPASGNIVLNGIGLKDSAAIRNLDSRTGDTFWVYAGPDINTFIGSSSGSVNITGSYCDDGLLRETGLPIGYTITWTIVSSPMGSSPTLTNSNSNTVTLNYDASGTYVLLYTVTKFDIKGSISVKFDEVNVNVNTISVDISGPIDVCAGEEYNYIYTAINQVGSSPYMYAWDNGSLTSSSTYTFTTPGVQTISLNFYDSFGNLYVATLAVTVYQFAFSPVITRTGNTVLTNCAGSSTTLTATTLGDGFWNDPLNTTTPTLTLDAAWFAANSPGTPYTFYWTENDPSGKCTDPESNRITVQPPVPIQLRISTLTPNVCGVPTNQGAINLEVLNGCPGYTYAWTGPNGYTESSQDISNLANGTYTVTVTDSAAPPQTVTLSVDVITSNPTINLVSLVNLCDLYANTGYIEVDVTGGTGPYTYIWTKIQRGGNVVEIGTSPYIDNLSTGLYQVTVIDALGCSATETYSIGVDSAINISFSVTPITCAGSCTGEIIANVTGGTGSYTYLWSNGETGDQIGNNKIFQGVCQGTYTVTVTDSNGCSAFSSIVLEPLYEQITYTSQITQLSATQSGGAIFITEVQGGDGDYSYSWDGPDGFTSSSQNITNLEAGTYYLTITDSHGCTTSGEFLIQTECDTFTTAELKVELFKIQCCAGVLAKEYVRFKATGREDLAECKLVDLKYLTLVIDTLLKITDLPDSCLSCDDILNILDQVKKICDCDCCKEFGENTYSVTYNPDTCELDTLNQLDPAPIIFPTGKELREDGSSELREDGSSELREN